MKFRAKIKGKDSASEGVAEVVASNLKATERFADPETHGSDEWDAAFDKEYRKLMGFVVKFVQEGGGGSDSVTLEFDTEAKTCVVVPLRKVK